MFSDNAGAVSRAMSIRILAFYIFILASVHPAPTGWAASDNDVYAAFRQYKSSAAAGDLDGALAAAEKSIYAQQSGLGSANERKRRAGD